MRISLLRESMHIVSGRTLASGSLPKGAQFVFGMFSKASLAFISFDSIRFFFLRDALFTLISEVLATKWCLTNFNEPSRSEWET